MLSKFFLNFGSFNFFFLHRIKIILALKYKKSRCYGIAWLFSLNAYWSMKWLYLQMARSQSVVKMPFHPFYLHFILHNLHNLYIRLFYTHSIHTFFTLCFYSLYVFLCVFYDSIHVLNVMFFSEPYLVLFIIKVSKQVYKVMWWSRIFQLKINESRGPGERVSGECGGNHTTDWLRAICR